MFNYNVVSYINRLKHEPQTLGELFRDLECELESLAISMQLFIKILTKISEIENVVKDNKKLSTDYRSTQCLYSKRVGFYVRKLSNLYLITKLLYPKRSYFHQKSSSLSSSISEYTFAIIEAAIPLSIPITSFF